MSIDKENLQSADGSLDATQSEEIVKKENTIPQDNNVDYDDEADKDQQQEHDKNNSHEEDDNEKRVELKDYDDMSLSQVVAEASLLMGRYEVVQLKEAFHNLREAFHKIYLEQEQAAKEKFIEQGGNEIDFSYTTKDKTDFDKVYYEYKNRLGEYYRSLEKKQEESLKERNHIIEELKALYTEPSNENKEIFKKFRDLKTRWHNAGRIPKAKANTVFKTYYFHLDNFHKFLDMNQELRKMDYEHNLEVRHSIIKRAENLLNEDNIQKALNELQYLHRMWKEEAVPVAEEYREPTWQKFKELTSKIHDRKNELSEQIKKQFEENLIKKNNIIAKIKQIVSDTDSKSHNFWQKKIKEVKKLREEFFVVGRVPKSDNQPTWDKFKDITREFNHKKNAFYKELKAEQMQNLEKKRKLIEIAKEHRDSNNWNESVRVIKNIQSEWKKIGHVPRKHSDKIWKEFSEANNYFFDRYKNRNNEKIEQQKANLEKKKSFLEELKQIEKPSDKEELLSWLNEKNIQWSSIGYVPNGKQDINKEFVKLTEQILKDAGLDTNAIEQAKWQSQIDQVKNELDDSLLRKLKFDIRKQIDDKQKEVSQLQTNLAFFSNADESNPLFKNAISNIEQHVNELNELKSKYEDLKLINLEVLAEHQKEEAGSEEE